MILRWLVVIPFTVITISYIFLVLSHKNINDTEFTISYKLPEDEQELTRLGLTPKSSIHIQDSNGMSRLIHGRFLHITDMHPDEFYKVGSSIEESCHHSKGKGDDRASKYGDAVKGCDSPQILVEESLQWIADNLKDKIDFVIWTGDNIRHDNDRRYPRLETDIFEMNGKIADLMHKTFAKKDDGTGSELFKIVPSLGNNDVYPHNLFSPGPTLQTRELYKIWKDFVPSEQLHVFARGAYYFSEIIPNKLAVLSINTLYLFRSNPLVDNCDNKKQPGYKLFEWLGYTLKELRARGMKVWLTGHVPPTPKNYDTTCLRKHIVWLYEYRDIIIGSLYGHMNIDHFIPLDAQKAYKSINKSLKRKTGLKSDFFISIADEDEEDDDDDFNDLEEINSYLNIIADDEIFGSEPHIMGGAPMGKVEYMESIRDAFYSRVKGVKNRGVNSERYSIAHISSSIVPTFNPGIRVWEYNITGLFDESEAETYQPQSWDEFFMKLDDELLSKEDDEDEELDFFITRENILLKDKTFPPKMPLGTPLGPGYTPQVFSPQRYVQYYVNLSKMNAQDNDTKLSFEIEYTSDDDEYKLETLLVDDWIKFARKLGEPVKAKRDESMGRKVDESAKKSQNKLQLLWKLYLNRSFVNTGYEDMKEYN